MSAQNTHATGDKRIYFHVYNKGIENKILFNDEEDYRVFTGYLKDYLTAPQSPESTKRDFTVHGRVFRGTPHQPKNYLNKVELLAYSLMPDHFHLLLHEKTQGSLEGFIRSLSTRYSIYFNKKYQRAGALFVGPYKSLQITNETDVLVLSHYLHKSIGQSSYLEYLGSHLSTWVETKTVRSMFESIQDDTFNGADGYRYFVDKYELNEEQLKLQKSLIFEKDPDDLERIDLARSEENIFSNEPTDSIDQIYETKSLKPLQRFPEFFTILIVFLLLLTVGVRGIILSRATTSESVTLGAHTDNTPVTPKLTPQPAVSAQKDTVPVYKDIVSNKKTVSVSLKNVSDTVNVRKEPSTNSEAIGKAKNGEKFEFVSLNKDWYEVKLPDGTTGFIVSNCITEDAHE